MDEELEPLRTVVDSNAWLELTSDEDGYALWERGVAEPVERFPATDQGADDAWTAYRQRSRDARSAGFWSTGLPRILFSLVVAGAILWLIGGTAFFLEYTSVFRSGTRGTWWLWFQAIDAFGERLCVGSAAVLVAWFVLRRWRAQA